MSFGKLYYRNLEQEIIKGNYNATFHKLGREATNELQWWIRHIPLANSSAEVDIIITTDASEQGWGSTGKSASTGRKH